ncbi:MAG: tRNA (adenosine(37)-N6)-threonylcarbamoyltransferase complex ATPase subunit type 1 TsaE, partial [Candidatus Roizmanbacteria bacterium]
MKITKHSTNLAETSLIAQDLLAKIKPLAKDRPVVVLFDGELGTGKTAFVKALASDLGVNSIISPTFVICYEYDVDDSIIKNFYHVDLYRIQEESEFPYLGLEDLVQKNSILCIEWSENGLDYLVPM